MTDLFSRAAGKGRRILISHFARRELKLDTPVPLISFSFDDAPRTAFDTGGKILESHGARGTYFMSLGLLSTTSEIGPIARPVDVLRAAAQGHELGCHTFHHHDAWHTKTQTYLSSVDENQRALDRLLPERRFRTFAYPKSGATLAVKSALARRFDCCRGGGQMFNSGVVDLNLLSSCFLDRRARVDLRFVRSLIDRNAEARGWLIFAAHDISDEPSDFSCAPGFFESIVRQCVDSGAQLLTVAQACEKLRS